MNVIEVSPSVPELIRLFLDVRDPEGDFLSKATSALAREKANHYLAINKFLENEIVHAGLLIEKLSDYQAKLEVYRELNSEIEDAYHDLKEQVQSQQVELHRAKVKLNDLKVALCRFIASAEAPKKDFSKMRGLEEWMDAATMAEMRLSRALEVKPNVPRQQFLSLFTTFRSVLVSFDGPSQLLRQMESSWASLEALHEKVHLELDVEKSAERLAETRKELSTVKLNLTSLQTRMKNQQAHQAGHLEIQKKSWGLRLIPLWIFLASGVGAFLYLREDARNMNRKATGVTMQASCMEIAQHLAESPRYQSQVLIFRKYGQDVYFKANAASCEKLHRLDSAQVSALSNVLQIDFEKGNREVGVFNGRRVLQVKDVGVNKLVVQLANPTIQDIQFKLKVLESATLLKAVLESGPNGDALIVSLPSSDIQEN